MVEKITPAEAIRLLDAGKAQAVDVRVLHEGAYKSFANSPS